MCGIVGITSTKKVSATILNSLRKLEYRGYDSAGIATLESGNIKEVKCEGRVDVLEHNLSKQKLEGNIGIGHVRWATHGVPSIVNAHPHSSDKVSVVHNGIIENSTILKKLLIKKGYVFKSQTDTEVILFIKMKDKMQFNEKLNQTIRFEIKSNLSPKHVPSKIFQVNDIPKTKSGKVVELTIKSIINGNDVKNKNALANPDCLKEYQNIYQELNKG